MMSSIYKKHRINDSGYSLVEIIMVVTIMSVFIGVAGFGLSLSNGKPAEECARKLTAALQQARTTTMGKYRNKIEIKNEAGVITVYETIVQGVDASGDDDPTKTTTKKSIVGGKGVTVKYTVGGSETELTPGNSVKLRFNSGTGSLKEPVAGNDYSYCTKFEISKAGTVKYVHIETLTGRIVTSDMATP